MATFFLRNCSTGIEQLKFVKKNNILLNGFNRLLWPRSWVGYRLIQMPSCFVFECFVLFMFKCLENPNFLENDRRKKVHIEPIIFFHFNRISEIMGYQLPKLARSGYENQLNAQTSKRKRKKKDFSCKSPSKE